MSGGTPTSRPLSLSSLIRMPRACGGVTGAQVSSRGGGLRSQLRSHRARLLRETSHARCKMLDAGDGWLRAQASPSTELVGQQDGAAMAVRVINSTRRQPCRCCFARSRGRGSTGRRTSCRRCFAAGALTRDGLACRAPLDA